MGGNVQEWGDGVEKRQFGLQDQSLLSCALTSNTRDISYTLALIFLFST